MPETKDLLVSNVPVEVIKKAQEIAREQQRPVAQVVRELLRVWIAQEEAKAKAK